MPVHFTDKSLWHFLKTITGQINPKELFVLYNYAAALHNGSTIVEIGSYKGKSTVALGLAAKQNGSRVYCIDPHENFKGIAGGVFGPADLKDKLAAINKFDLGDIIFPVCLSSVEVAKIWQKPIDLLWIDGDHSYETVSSDFLYFSRFVNQDGIIIFHDSQMDGVAKVIAQIDMNHYMEKAIIDSITIIKKR